MEENQKFFKETKEYKIHTKKIENVLTVLMLMLFMFSLTGGTAANILFFGVAGVVMLYYFIVFRKRNKYVILEGNHVTVRTGILLTPVVMDTKSITNVSKTDKEISLEYNENETSRKVSVKSLLMDPDDFNNLYNQMKD
ncbi:MAG: hypothetical protein N2484_07370 [Clostridia bacterium]|nr:hypothetical protein [Clostridia bacterium]